jgi:hypothetical protein
MKLVTPLSEAASAVCKNLQRVAARGTSLANDIADIVGASQTMMREIVEHLDDIGTATHQHNPDLHDADIVQRPSTSSWIGSKVRVARLVRTQPKGVR